MAQYGVLVIRGQQIDDEEHIRFSRAFGSLELPPNLGMPTPEGAPAARLYDASNLDADGELLDPDSPRRKYNRGNELFHTDSSFNDLPTKWSLLLATCCRPPAGTPSSPTSAAVYAALPPATKARLDGLVAEHNLWHFANRAASRR